MLICFFALATACIAGDMLLEKFLYKKEVEKFEAIHKGVIKNIIDNERGIEAKLANALLLFEKYLEEKLDLSTANLISFAKLANISSASVYSRDGRLIGASTGVLENPKTKGYFKTYSLVDRLTDPNTFFAKNRNIAIYPFYKAHVANQPNKPFLMWSKKLNLALNCTMRSNIVDVMSNYLTLYQDIKSILITAPSGKIIATTSKNWSDKLQVVEHYDERILVLDSNTHFKATSSFGGIQKENAGRILDKEVNAKNEYFYTLISIFSKQPLNKQIWINRFIFMLLFILSLVISFLTTNIFYSRRQYHESLKLQAQQVHHDIANPVQALDWSIDAMNFGKKYNESVMVHMKQQIGLGCVFKVLTMSISPIKLRSQQT